MNCRHFLLEREVDNDRLIVRIEDRESERERERDRETERERDGRRRVKERERERERERQDGEHRELLRVHATEGDEVSRNAA